MLFLPIILFGLAISARSVIQQEEWDFIIAGGGSAGLTLALRLSANPGVKVLVLEAGPDHAGDITVASPGIFGTMYGNLSYHWEHRIIPQRGLNNRSHAVMAGKGLGGGSAINFLFWTHASRRDIDDWGALGNKNWSWEKLQPYYKKSETFISPSSQQVTDLDLTYLDQSLHGNNGSTVNSFPSTYGPLSSAWPRTFANLGLAVDGDPRGGKATGGFQNPFNINPATNERSYPGSTYTSIAKTRPNLIVITGAFVTKVLFTKLRGVHTATGILYVKDNTTHQATTKREVIISLGGLASPKLLELSGIGDRTLLQSLGIKALTHNPNVGENYQNHLMIPLGFAANPDVPTAEDFSSPSVFQSALSQYISNRTGPFTTVNASSALLTLSQIGLNTSSLLTDLPPLTKEESLIVNSLTLQESPSPAAQLILIQSGMSPQQYNSTLLAFRSPSTSPSDGKFITILALPQRPLSRGSVHISSPDPFTLPIVNSRDLTHPLDIKIAAASVLATQKIASAAPLSSFLMQDKDGNPVFQPGYYHVNNSNVENFVREFAFLTFHFSGTCSMLPRHKGGVVDERFRVYDTKGLRVVDSSVFPLLPAATINSAVIAVAERAADFIKEDYGF